MARGSKLSPAPKKAGPSKGAAPVVRANSVSVRGDRGHEKSVCIEKIENGYLVRESSYGPKGDYRCKTTFSAKPPTVQVAPGKK